MSVLLLLLLAQKTAFVEGTVVGTDGAGPLGKARVEIRYEKAPDGKGRLTSENALGNKAVTGDDGMFRLEVVEGVPFHFALEREGYVSAGQQFGAGPATSSYTLKGDKTGVVLKMDAEALLGGRLLDEDSNEPIEGVRVMVHRRLPEGIWIPGVGGGRSDAQGRYRIQNLPPGDYKLQIESEIRPRLKTKDPGEGRAYPGLYYPGVKEFGAGEKVKLTANGRLEHFDFKLKKEALFVVRGEVSAGESSEAIQVNFSKQFGQEGVMVGSLGKMTGSGKFEIQNLPEGRLELTFFTMTKDDRERKQGVVDLLVRENVDDLQLNLEGGLKVQVVVKTLGDHPVDGDPLWTQFKRQLSVQFSPMQRGRFSTDQPVYVDSVEGKLMEGVFPELTWLHVAGLPRGWVLRKVIYNRIEVPFYALKLDASRPSHLVEIFVSPVSNGINGEVSGGGVEVVALPEPLDGEMPYRRMRKVSVGAEGRFSFENLRPGSYHVISLLGDSYVEAIEAIRAGKGKRVELTENGVVRVKLEALNP